MNYKTRQPFLHAAYVEGQRNFTYFDRSLTSGLTDVVIESPGDFLYIDQASTGVVSVELNMRQGGTLAPILLAAGGSIECDFSSIKINAVAQLGKTVRVVVGNGVRIKSGGTVNPSSNMVSVVDGGRQRTENQKAFASVNYRGAVAGQLPHVQLWNPATNTANLFIEKIAFASTTACSAHFRTSSAALANSSGSSVAANLANKRMGGTASVAQIRNETSAAQLGDETLMGFYLAASVPLNYELREPIMVPPGKGFIVSSNYANVDLLASIEFFEE